MASQSGPQTNTTHSITHIGNMAMATAISIALLIFAWFHFHHFILTAIFGLRYHEIEIIEFFVNQWATLASVLHLPTPNLVPLHNVKQLIVTTPDQEINFETFFQANQIVGHWMRYPMIAILLLSAVLIKIYRADSRFDTIYTTQKLKKTESQNWPQIIPVVSLDLLNEDLDQGPWAMSKMPMDFCKEHNLLYVGEKDGKKIWKIKANAAQSIFSLQLGPLWTDIQALPIEVKALIVIFTARALRDRDISNRFLKQIAASATSSGKLNFAGVEQQLQKYVNAKPIKWLEKRHAYVTTFMASLLEISRSDGVLATAEFLWLKPINRRLWYTLNTVGRMTSVVEVSGVYAHWLAEKKLGRGVKVPMAKEAVTALEKSIEDILYIEEGSRWHTHNAA